MCDQNDLVRHNLELCMHLYFSDIRYERINIVTIDILLCACIAMNYHTVYKTTPLCTFKHAEKG